MAKRLLRAYLYPRHSYFCGLAGLSRLIQDESKTESGRDSRIVAMVVDVQLNPLWHATAVADESETKSGLTIPTTVACHKGFNKERRASPQLQVEVEV
jgi:hypothetical protein